MFSVTHVLYQGVEVIIYVVALVIFIPAIYSNPRYLDANFAACFFSANNGAIPCCWCLLVKYVAIAFDFFINLLNQAASFFGAANLTNPVAGQGGSPTECVQKQGTDAYLTLFYALSWITFFYIFIVVCLAIIRALARFINGITKPFQVILGVFARFFFDNGYRKMA